MHFYWPDLRDEHKKPYNILISINSLLKQTNRSIIYVFIYFTQTHTTTQTKLVFISKKFHNFFGTFTDQCTVYIQTYICMYAWVCAYSLCGLERRTPETSLWLESFVSPCLLSDKALQVIAFLSLFVCFNYGVMCCMYVYVLYSHHAMFYCADLWACVGWRFMTCPREVGVSCFRRCVYVCGFACIGYAFQVGK